MPNTSNRKSERYEEFYREATSANVSPRVASCTRLGLAPLFDVGGSAYQALSGEQRIELLLAYRQLGYGVFLLWAFYREVQPDRVDFTDQRGLNFALGTIIDDLLRARSGNPNNHVANLSLDLSAGC